MTVHEHSPVQYFEIPDFCFQDGSKLSSIHLAYLDINPSAQKTALILTCFRGHLQTTPTFADGSLRDYRIIIVALFGNGESSSPSNSAQFPKSLDYRDCVRAQRLLLEDLGIKVLDLALGFSMGGQCTYHWAVMYPDYVRNAVMICSSARTSRHNYQFLEGPKAGLENSVDYVNRNANDFSESSKPIRGLRSFGKAYSAWLTSAEWFDRETYLSSGYASFEDWDHQVAGTNYYSWHPEDLLAMLRMWQKGDITKCQSPIGTSLEETLVTIKARVLLMPCLTDQYFRLEASKKEAAHIPFVTLRVIPSIWGHLAGAGSNREDTEWMDREIAEFLAVQS